MAIYFISDLHLRAEQPHLTRLFEYFTTQLCHGAQSVYILGDLFEVWLGDDMALPEYRPAMTAIQQLTERGVPVYFIYGNRDFLLREQFCDETGVTLLNDPTLISLYDTPTLLMHGDTLCTDDTRYQEFRHMVRDPMFQQQFLAKSASERRAIVSHYRDMSKAETRYKAEDIMDVNADAVAGVMRKYGVYQLIHGHTHRPAIHTFLLDGQPAKRIVLADWQQHGAYLRCTPQSCRLETFHLPSAENRTP